MDEIVETSDTEEQEELDAIESLWNHQYSSPDPLRSPQITPILPASVEPSTPGHIHNNTEDESTDSEVQHSNRYSLRVRQAKQINPYEYDKRFYRRQMRSNPDAIVNVVSPRKASDHSGHNKSSNEDDDDEETRTLARKARRISEQTNVEERDRIKTARSFPLTKSFLSKHAYGDRERSPDELTLSDGSLPRTNAVLAAHTEVFPWRSMSPQSGLISQGDTQSESERGTPPDSLQSHSLFSSSMPPEDDRHNYNTDSDLDIQRNTRNSSAMGGSSDVDHDVEQSPQNRDSESSGASSPNIKGLRYLKKAWPAVMVNQHLENLRESPAKRQRISRRSEDESGVLQPGQSRVRKVTHSQSGRLDVRGDPESSEGLSTPSEEEPEVQREGESDTGSANPPLQRKRRRYVRPIVEVLDISDSDDDVGSTDSDVDDTQINAWLRHKGNHNHRNRLKQENLIDWMLSRTRTVGASRKTARQLSKTVAKTQGPSKLRVITAGVRQYGDGRQTILSFDKPSKRKQPPGDHLDIADRNNFATARRSTAQGTSSVTVSTIHDGQGQRTPTVTARRKRKSQGQASLHLFRSESTRITSGRRRRHAITIDMEDELFYKALAPTPRNTKERLQAESTLLPIPNILRKQHAGIEMSHEELPRCSQPSACHRDIKLDFDIVHLPSGITFDPDTYVGRGWLHELVSLVSSDADVSEPGVYAAHEIELIPTMSMFYFSTALTFICDQLFDVATQSAREHFRWEGVMHAACQFVSWLPIKANNEDCHLLRSSVHEQILRLITRVNDYYQSSTSYVDTSVATAVYAIHWFAIEICTRLDHSLRRRLEALASNALEIDKYILLLIRHLLTYGLARTIGPIQDRRERLDARSTAQRAAELWICLINLLGCRRLDPREGELCWRMVHQGLESMYHSVPSGLEASEVAWQTIFSLCALSQFSSHGMTTSKGRLPASWDLVAFALKQIQLTADLDDGQRLSDRSLDKRDDYIWLITSRCFILWNRWHWCLDEASNMFRHLANIFRSRKFANLRREPSDFPGFMLNNDVRLLSQYRSSDTAFQLFLKLIVHAARSGPDIDDNPQRVSPKTSKLLSLALPVGSVPFTKTTPPSLHELSMLYNRFSVIALALYLDSSPGKVHSRLTQARAYVKFKDADDMTRIACIRGAMHFAILMQDRQIPLDDVLSWLEDMSVILVNEYAAIVDATGARDRLIFSIQVLLGSIRRIIETPHMDPTKSRSIYPDASLLEGAWVTRIFSNTTNLTNLAKTGMEIRRLVQAFLDARAGVMPVPRYRHPMPTVTEDSQDNYGPMELDLDDAELLAALGEEHSLTASHNTVKDQRVCKVIEDHISPAIYRLVTKYFGEQYDNASFDEYCLDADMWISCWVGCANVLVQNHKKDWSWFLRLGPQSWERIIQQSHRRRVGLQFMFMLLQLDPNVYLIHRDLFLKVLLECLVSVKITIENKYMSLLFSIDGFQHPLLHGVLPQPISNPNISQAEFLTLRLSIMRVIFANLAESLCRENEGEQGLTEQNQICVGFFVNMFSTMQDIYEQIAAGTNAQLAYLKFCRQVFDMCLQHPEFTLQLRLVNWIEWGSNLH